MEHNCCCSFSHEAKEEKRGAGSEISGAIAKKERERGKSRGGETHWAGAQKVARKRPFSRLETGRESHLESSP